MMEKRNCNGSAEIELRRLASSDPFKIEHFRVRDLCFGKCNSSNMRSLFTSFSRYVIRESIKLISFVFSGIVYSHSKYYSI